MPLKKIQEISRAPKFDLCAPTLILLCQRFYCKYIEPYLGAKRAAKFHAKTQSELGEICRTTLFFRTVNIPSRKQFTVFLENFRSRRGNRKYCTQQATRPRCSCVVVPSYTSVSDPLKGGKQLGGSWWRRIDLLSEDDSGNHTGIHVEFRPFIRHFSVQIRGLRSVGDHFRAETWKKLLKGKYFFRATCLYCSSFYLSFDTF